MQSYQRKLLEKIQSGEIKAEGIQNVEILHDEWCRAFRGGECNCDPEIKARRSELVQ